MADLFTHSIKEDREYLFDLVGDWIDVFSSSEIEYIEEVCKKVGRARATSIVHPHALDMLAPLKRLNLNDVRVVIIGQDPYPNYNANGHAFACAESLSPSLSQIIQCIRVLYNNNNSFFDISLNHWINQGVLLLNTVFTVEHGKPFSHSTIGWKKVSTMIIKYLNTHKDIIWFLWGNEAIKKAKIISKNHKIFTAEHPVVAHRNNSFWLVNHFIEANKFLNPKINWLHERL